MNDEEKIKLQNQMAKQGELVKNLMKKTEQEHNMKKDEEEITSSQATTTNEQNETKKAIVAKTDDKALSISPLEPSKADSLDDQNSSEAQAEYDFSANPWAPLRLSKKKSITNTSIPENPKQYTNKTVKNVKNINLSKKEVVKSSTWSETLIAIATCIDIVDQISQTLDTSSPNALNDILRRILSGLMMQKEFLVLIKEIIGEANSDLLDELGRHIKTVLEYIKDFLESGQNRKIHLESTMQVQEAVERGSQVLEKMTIQTVITYFLDFTEYLTPGMITVLAEIVDMWRKEGLDMRLFVHAISAIRKELSIIDTSTEIPDRVHENNRDERLIHVLDQALSLFAIDNHDHQSGVRKFGTAQDDLHLRQSENMQNRTNEMQNDENIPHSYDSNNFAQNLLATAMRVPSPMYSPSSKLFPISPASISMPQRSITPVDGPPSSLAYLMGRISDKLHHHHHKSALSVNNDTKGKGRLQKLSKSPIMTKPVISSPLPSAVGFGHPISPQARGKMPDQDENLPGPSSPSASRWRRHLVHRNRSRSQSSRPKLKRSNSTTSSFSITYPYSSTSTPVAIPATDDYSDPGSEQNSHTIYSSDHNDNSAPDYYDYQEEVSSPSRYSEDTDTSTISSSSTKRSDRMANELLASADSGPRSVRQDWIDNEIVDKDTKDVEVDEDELKRAEKVLYDKVIPAPTITMDQNRRDRLKVNII
ncbi:uncharacterized protein L201_001342 [Kwoniella dendrophila CBS 6074]|uniref:TOG domain-containing protein n=1 Tax=Kwoniella dendrophila CBS 6074 TaxID=1295534 RepID=A0AAX4JPI7_9TREE